MNNELICSLYQKLAEELKKQIDNGVLKENEKLLSEIELSKKYSVSRITVRKAMEILVDGGYVTKHQGIGTFVASRKLNRINGRGMGFTDVCECDGKVASSDLLSVEWMSATVTLSQHLCVEEGERIIRIRRVRNCDGVPVMIEINHFSSRFSYLLEQNLTQSIYSILRSHGDIPKHGTKTVEVGYATSEEAEYLKMTKGGVLLILKDTVLDDGGQVTNYCRQIINPERYKLTIMS